VKTIFQKEKYSDSSPVLTSDYLVEDLTHYFCEQRQNVGDIHNPDVHGGGWGRRAVNLSDVCHENFSSAEKKATAAVRTAMEKDGESDGTLTDLKLKYLSSNWPDIGEHYRLFTEKKEALQAKITATPNIPVGERQKIEAEILKYRDAGVIEYEQMWDSVKEMPDFIKFVAGENKSSLLRENRDTSSALYKAMAARKDLIRDNQQKRRDFVVARLARATTDEEREMRKIYESIQACEASPIP
jgi:hypothetical protein